MKTYSFEKLGCWQHARQLAVETYKIKTVEDQSFFSTVSYSSAIELLNNLTIACNLNFLPNELYIQGRNLNIETNFTDCNPTKIKTLNLLNL